MCTMCFCLCSYGWICVLDSVSSIVALYLLRLFQLNREAHRLRSVSYCELIIPC